MVLLTSRQSDWVFFPSRRTVGTSPNTRTRRCGHVLVFGHHFLPPRHEEHDHKVTSFVSGVSLCSSLHLLPPRHEECDPVVMFFMSGVSLCLPSTFYHPDTKDMTLWSHSSCLGSSGKLALAKSARFIKNFLNLQRFYIFQSLHNSSCKIFI